MLLTRYVNDHSYVTPEETDYRRRQQLRSVQGNDSSLYETDKNRLFGSKHHNSGRHVVKPSPWSEGNFEEQMAVLLRWASELNASVPTFAQAPALLEAEDSVMGRVIRLSKLLPY